jgi:hypothetical protein
MKKCHSRTGRLALEHSFLARIPGSLTNDHHARRFGGTGKVKRNNSKEVKEPLDNLSRIAYKAKG